MNLPLDYNLLTFSERKNVREAYIKAQKGLCYYCKSSLQEEPPDNVRNKKIYTRMFPPRFFKYPHHLHHSHSTGLTIGTVHSYCNAVLWQYHGE